MKPDKRSKLQKKSAIEIDSDDGDFSNGSDEEWCPNSKKSDRKNANISSEDSRSEQSTPDDEPSTSVDLPFKTTTGFNLKIVKTYKSSKHPVWLMFGYLMREEKIINRVKDRFFCKKCFDKEKFKR